MKDSGGLEGVSNFLSVMWTAEQTNMVPHQGLLQMIHNVTSQTALERLHALDEASAKCPYCQERAASTCLLVWIQSDERDCFQWEWHGRRLARSAVPDPTPSPAEAAAGVLLLS